MHFLDSKTIEDFSDMILEFPALSSMDDLTRSNFKDILQKFFYDLYVKKIENVQNYLQFNITDDLADQILKDYGIDKSIINSINPVFKKSLIYFLEKLFQKKGSIEVLQIFNQIFESLFSSINFYKIIVVKNYNTTINDDGTKTVNYFLSYALDPLYINDPDKLLKFFDSKISLTGKFLMDLDQFKDFKVFPVDTNLVYMQFTSTEINLDNLKTFSTGVKAYALTSIKGKMIPLRNFYGKYLDIEASDLSHLIFYLEMYRKRKINPNFDFHLDKDKAYLSLIMDKDNLYELESFLHEYKLLPNHDRKKMKDFKRRWNSFIKNYFTTERPYHNFDELEKFIKNNYPDLIDIRIQYLDTDEDYLNFYIDLYLIVLGNINIEDKYINLYINSLFLSVITGDAFIENFFLPIYKIFQKYFFPIEMDFLSKIIQTFIVKDKFESLMYEHKIAMQFDSKSMSKHYLRADEILLYLIRSNTDKLNFEDKDNIQVQSFIQDKAINNEIIQTLIDSSYSDIFKNIDKQLLTILSTEKDKNYVKNNIFTEVDSEEKDQMSLDHTIFTTVNISNSSKQKINESTSSNIDSNFTDNLTYNEKKTSVIDRYNYTQVYDKLSIYLDFEELESQTKTSNETNTRFKFERADDQIYFSIHKIF